MMNKYLMADPVPWLTDGSDPAVRYNVKLEILNDRDHDKIYSELLNSDLTDYFLKNLKMGVLGDKDHLDVFYKGTVWFFLLAVESGYKSSEEFIKSTADFLCEKTQSDNGGFRYRNSEMAVGCRSGEMIYAIVKSGIIDERTEKGISWIVNNQRKDGGWFHCPVAGICNILKLVLLNKTDTRMKYEYNQNVPSCPVASYSCLKALIQFNRESDKEIIKKGIDFFTINNFFVKSVNKISCGNGVSFNMNGYPLMSQYDYLSGMIIASKTGYFTKSELFNSIIKKQNKNGSWNNENGNNGMIEKNTGESMWTTLNALRLIKAMIDIENQLEKE